MGTKHGRRLLPAGQLLALIACASVGWMGMGCNKQPWKSAAKSAAEASPQAEKAKAKEGEAVQHAAAAPSGLSGPCADFVKRVCSEAEGTPCTNLTASAKLLSPAACRSALADMKYTLGVLEKRKGLCASLEEKLCGDLGKETQTCVFVREKIKGFNVDRCEGMLAQYDQVLTDLRRMEERNKPLSAQKQAKIAAADAPSFGPPHAKVTVVEFSDFECPYCSKAVATVKEIKKRYPNQVRVVFRQFPLSFHQNAEPAAQASLAAHAQGKFWEYHDKLFENQKSLDRASLEKFAGELGLNLKAFKKALDESTYGEAVKKDLDLGKEASVSGTPSMFVNGERVNNPYDFAAVQKLIDQKLAEG